MRKNMGVKNQFVAKIKNNIEQLCKHNKIVRLIAKH